MNTVFTAFEHEKKTSFGSFEVITRVGSKTPEKTAGVYEHGKPHGVKQLVVNKYQFQKENGK